MVVAWERTGRPLRRPLVPLEKRRPRFGAYVTEPSSASAADAPPGISCRWYERGAATKRCKHYGTGGTCALPAIEICVEWLKVNPPGAALGESASRPTSAQALPPACGPSPAPTVEPLAELTHADLASFRALRVEVRVVSEAHGELWLVPAYTHQPRREITPEHVLVISRLLARFPGAHIAALLPPERPERLPKRRRS